MQAVVQTFADGGRSHGTGDSYVSITGTVTHALTHEGADASEDGTGRGTPIVAATYVDRGRLDYIEGDVTLALCARDGKDERPAIAIEHGRPRRLTPRECERLMGWPDDWTRYGVKEDGTRYELSDTARYRICGNGVGSPCAEWIARRFP
jgi:DNA (cytosine-5)-methyltransferase 1